MFVSPVRHPTSRGKLQRPGRVYEPSPLKMSFASSLNTLATTYASTTPTTLKACDVYLAFLVLTGVIQFAYCLLVGTFPFNSMLAGFIATVANFVLAGASREGGLMSKRRCGCRQIPQTRTLERARKNGTILL